MAVRCITGDRWRFTLSFLLPPGSWQGLGPCGIVAEPTPETPNSWVGKPEA